MFKPLKNLFANKGRVENARLLSAMDAVAHADTRENRTALYRALLDAQLIMPIPEVPEQLRGKFGEPVTTTESVRVQMVVLNDRHGDAVTSVFTDVEALRNWDPNTPFLRLDARAYFEMVRQSKVVSIVVNPFDPIRKMLRPGGRIMRFEFDTLADGYIPQGAPDDSGGMKMNVRNPLTFRPGKLPEGVTETATDAAKNLPEVLALYSAEMIAEGTAPRKVVGVVFNSGCGAERKEQCIRRVAASVQKVLQPYESVDFIEVPPSAMQSEQPAPPFYTRSAHL